MKVEWNFYWRMTEEYNIGAFHLLNLIIEVWWGQQIHNTDRDSSIFTLHVRTYKSVSLCPMTQVTSVYWSGKSPRIGFESPPPALLYKPPALHLLIIIEFEHQVDHHNKHNRPAHSLSRIHLANPQHYVLHIISQEQQQWPLGQGRPPPAPRPWRAACPVLFVTMMASRGSRKGTSPWCCFATTTMRVPRRRGSWCAWETSRSHAWRRCWRWPSSSLGTGNRGCSRSHVTQSALTMWLPWHASPRLLLDKWRYLSTCTRLTSCCETALARFSFVCIDRLHVF